LAIAIYAVIALVLILIDLAAVHLVGTMVTAPEQTRPTPTSNSKRNDFEKSP
jgi:hypothetical protein